MNQMPAYRPWLGTVLALALLTAACSPWPTALAEGEAEATGTALAPTMRRLATTGSFDKLGDLLKTEQARHSDAKLTALLRDIDLYRKHAADHTAVRRKAFDLAYKKMVDQFAAENLNDAIFGAIEASALADDTDIFLKDEKVVALVKTIEDRAKKADDIHDWLEALSFYRSIELLFDDSSLYSVQVKKLERQLRLVRFYAPDALQKMYDLRALKFKALKAASDAKKPEGEKKVEEDDEPIKVTAEPWEDRLKGITMSMFRQTISRAAHQHITNPGYTPLIKGALESLSIMAQTPGLEKSFTRFKDAERVAKFQAGIKRLQGTMDANNAPLNFLQASEIVDQITELNDTTLMIPEPVLVYELSDGATSKLDDFSAIIWPHDLEQFSRNVEGKFYGVGIQISKRDSRLTVVSPLEGTPAHRAGIRANDVIGKVNGEPTSDWSVDRAVREITGPEGTEVKLGIDRPGEQKTMDIVLRRAEIVIESIKGWDHKAGGGWDYYIDRENKIGYVRLSQFIPQSVKSLDEAVEMMEKDNGLSALILDLRGNPGGLLSSAVDISDRFVGEGTIVSTVNSANRETKRYEARADHSYRRFPIVLLVNQGSASASEIVSGAVQDYQRGLIIGNRSFGKGSVQDLFPMDGGKAALKLTTQYYRLPAGRILHRKPGDKTWGVNPDLEVKMTGKQIGEMIKYRQDVDIIRGENEKPADPKAEIPTAASMLEKGMDPQLSAALLVIKTGLVAENVAIAAKDAPAKNP